MIEELIAYHCGPALAGIKPANLVACSKERYPDAAESIVALNEQMNGADIYFRVLCECESRLLVMVYRRKKLTETLRTPEIMRFMRSLGYPAEFSLDGYLETLEKRLRDDDFPHEIGAFLGYPLRDIYGFIHHERCIFCGDWKVYHNADKARATFRRYKVCRRSVLRHIENGMTLAQLFTPNNCCNRQMAI